MIISLVLAYMLLEPYLTAILTSFLLAYLFYPFYRWVNKKIPNRNVSAAVASILIVIISTAAIGFVVFQLSQEADVAFIMLKQTLSEANGGECESGFSCTIINNVNSFLARKDVKYYITESVKSITSNITDWTINFLVSLPKKIILVFITFFITFFLLKDGKAFIRKVEEEIPIGKKHSREVYHQMNEVTRAIIYGFFLMALIQGIIMALALKIFGISSPILLGLIVAVVAFIPAIGASIIWIPAVLFQFLHGNVFAAVGLLAAGLIVSSIDTFLKPKIIGDQAKIHPVIVLLGVLGGLSLFGFIGIITGPLILALLFTFIKMYKTS